MKRHPDPRAFGYRRVLAMAVAVIAAIPAASPAQLVDQPQYNRDIRPILSDNCFACHGPDAKHREADLRLDVRDDAVRDRGGYTAITPGRPDESELWFRILSNDPAEVMPPPKFHKTLTAAQKELIRRWIAQGAEYQPHWAYVPPRRPDVPAVPETSKLRNPIDAFIQHALAGRGLEPSPEADRRTLIRRLSLDLIGLPPTPDEVQAFLRDNAPDAYERLVDRLLQSPHHGERMAQGWLDVARYADTVGFHGDQNQNAWPYRDYVIDAFNKNKPFDQFTIEQLAGDLLPNPTPEQLIATCFNRLNMMTREGGAQPKEYLAKYTADRIRTVGLAWLGSTLACAECHDHKFDPFTMKDFYSIGAFFADIKQWGVYSDYGYTPNPDLKGFTNDHPFPPEIVVESPALQRRLAQLQDQVEQVIDGVPRDDAAANAWKAGIRGFLGRHPDGWAAPTPTVRVSPATPTRKGVRAASAAADSPSANESPGYFLEDGQRIVFLNKAADTAEIDLEAPADHVAAIRVELLPEAKWDGRILRSGTGTATTIRPTFTLIRDGEKPRPLAIRHAQADRFAPRYANGFEVLGVQSGWLTRADDLSQPHTAVYLLDAPIALTAGDVIRVGFSNNALGAVRISLSPLAPDVGQTRFAADLARRLDDERTTRALFLRSRGEPASEYARLKTLEHEILACRDGKTPVMVTERTDQPLTIRVLARGNWMDESGAIREPATPAFLPPLPDSQGRSLTRLDLARWLCSDENPLTARVVMNRLWKQFFGQGLTMQVDDLGAQGDPPSHPELLDWLAVEFREGGWDLKRMVKRIVMSHTYRQVAGPRADVVERDPDNRWLSCQNPRRLEAEVVRDNALAIAGLLNLDQGGPPIHPYQPDGYYEGLQFPDRVYQAERDDRQYRRGVYMHWQRTFLHPMLANFDAPSREDCVALRVAANSPQQALTLLNDPEFVEAARVWADRLLAAPGASTDADRLALAFEQALARPIQPRERSSLLAFLDRVRSEYRDRPEDAAKLLEVGVASKTSGDPVERAAWTSVGRVILNLHETITRY
jgi:mono/diheme cytochrome c family protein